MRKAFQAPYDADLTSAMYQAYEDGDDSILNELITSLCPLIRILFNRIVKGHRRSERDELECNALEEMYRVVSGKSLPNDHPALFTRYLSTIISRSFMDSLNEGRTQVFDYWKLGRSPYNPSTGFAEVEAEILDAQVRDVIYNKVKSRIRFIGKEKLACEFILDCESGYKLLDPRVSRRVFKLTSHRSMYLIRYIRILLKAAALEQRSEYYKDGSITPLWEAGGGFLRTPSDFG